MISQLKHHASVVRSATFSPCGTVLLTASKDATVAICGAMTEVVVRRMKHHSPGVTSVDVIRRMQQHSQGVTSVVFSPDGGRIVSTSGDNTVVRRREERERERERKGSKRKYTLQLVYSRTQ